MEHIPDAFNWHDGRLFVRVGAKEYKSVSHGANETNLDGLFGLLACAPAASIDSYLRSHGYEVSPVASHCGSDSYLAAVREADEKAVK
jgi:hypothetical protein